jgi:hypothetical protein
MALVRASPGMRKNGARLAEDGSHRGDAFLLTLLRLAERHPGPQRMAWLWVPMVGPAASILRTGGIGSPLADQGSALTQPGSVSRHGWCVAAAGRRRR